MKQHNTDAFWSPIERQMGALLREEPVGECLSLDELTMLVERRERMPRYYEAMRHLLRCQECKQTYNQLQAVRSAAKPKLNLSAIFAQWRTPLQWAMPTAAVGVLLVWLRLFMTQPAIAPRLVADAEPAVSVAPAAAETSAPTFREPPPRMVTLPRSQKPAINLDTLFTAERVLVEQGLSETHRDFIASLTESVEWLKQLPAALGSDTSRNASQASIEQPVPHPPVQVRVNRPEGVGTNLAVKPSRAIELHLKVNRNSGSISLLIQVLEKHSGRLVFEKLLSLESVRTVKIPLEDMSKTYQIRVLKGADKSDGGETLVYASYEFRFLGQTPDASGLSELAKLELAQRIRKKAPLIAAEIFLAIDRRGDALAALKEARQRYPYIQEVESWIQRLEASQ